MKKILTKIFACLIVFASAFTLFACDDKKDETTLNQLLTDAITEIQTQNKTSNMLTKTGAENVENINGVQTDFALTSYIENSEYNYFNQAFIIPMNYIQKYSTDLSRLESIPSLSKESKDQINKLKKIIPVWTKNFKDTSDQYKNITNLGTADVVVEGATILYEKELVDLFKSTYDVALNLAEVRNLAFDEIRSLEETNVKLTDQNVIHLRDYFMLQTSYDFYNCLIVNLKAENFSKLNESAQEVKSFRKLIEDIKESFTDTFKLQALSEFNDLTGSEIVEGGTNFNNTKVKQLFKAYEAMKNEKVMLNKALENFSLYDYYFTYSCNIDAYTKKQVFAKNYYNEIQNYYTNYVPSYFEYLINVIEKTGE